MRTACGPLPNSPPTVGHQNGFVVHLCRKITQLQYIAAALVYTYSNKEIGYYFVKKWC